MSNETKPSDSLVKAAIELMAWYGPFNPTKHPPEINGAWLRLQSAIEALAPTTQGTDSGLAGEIADAWDDLVNVDDRTSPEEYPDMCLITRDELAEFMSRADPKISYWRALAKAALATRTDRKAVLEEAAKVADEIAEEWGKRWQYTSDKHETYENGRIAGWSDGAADVAKQIRLFAKDSTQ